MSDTTNTQTNQTEMDTNVQMKPLYTCKCCNTDYATIEAANECAKNHKLLYQLDDSNATVEKDGTTYATIKAMYKSKKSISNGAPYRITIKFGEDDKVFTYDLNSYK